MRYRYIIYKITNQINGKIYIGKHKCERLDDRYFGSGMALQHAIRKYGKENFTFHLEFELQNENEMDLLEKYVVNEEYLKRKDVYNLREGGEGGHLSEETRKKMSEAQKGKHHTVESRRKMSESLKGHIPWNYGKPTSEETRKKLSEALRGAKNPMYKKDWRVGKTKEEIEEHSRKISDVMKGKRCGEKHHMYGKHHNEESKQKIGESMKKYKWWNNGISEIRDIKCPTGYVSGKLKLSEEHKRKIGLASKKYADKLIERSSKPVIQYSIDGDFIKEFRTIKDAEKEIGKCGISKCCNGLYNQVGGFRWAWKEDTLYFF